MKVVYSSQRAVMSITLYSCRDHLIKTSQEIHKKIVNTFGCSVCHRLAIISDAPSEITCWLKLAGVKLTQYIFASFYYYYYHHHYYYLLPPFGSVFKIMYLSVVKFMLDECCFP